MASKVTWHAHGCLECHSRFADACSEPEFDKLCETCEWDRVRGFDYGQWDPRPCCMDAVEADADTAKKMSLRGMGPWFVCPTCVRSHPHVHPRERKDYECPDGVCDRTEKHHHRQGELDAISSK